MLYHRLALNLQSFGCVSLVCILDQRMQLGRLPQSFDYSDLAFIQLLILRVVVLGSSLFVRIKELEALLLLVQLYLHVVHRLHHVSLELVHHNHILRRLHFLFEH